ncbi:hypothetical protein D3C71_584750 [compost metagenome]
MRWHSWAALRRIRGDWSAGAAITTARASPSVPRLCSMNSRTSRPRSPMSPTTTIWALVLRVIMPSSMLLPTPEPANSPSRWPLPTVSRPLMARMPTSRGSRTGVRSRGLGGEENRGTRSPSSDSGRPSRGCSRPSSTRPSRCSPTTMVSSPSMGSTRAPA